ncbi:CRISPR-associated protein Cas2 [Solibacillus sp. R5-41]|uniref:AAA family ATPase n=1 Tax=Solibacillus sp. R5-41 TaxID=2048654 RepID=UPI000C126674|nr:AAA family ATPase [Solibacillus sp. R5-41]ATP39516.1 CRISPR-associated protein Cas2 [Solibacillus sp. R5-41]
MKRIAILTIGKTHSGKSTFAKLLEANLPNSVILDQDNHAAFINSYYQKLLPTSGPNILKFGLSTYILNYAIQQTNLHIILCNSNSEKIDRVELLNSYFPKTQFIRVLIYFNVNDEILLKRVKKSTRETNIFRDTSFSFEQLLDRQYNAINPPSNDEAELIFTVDENTDQLKLITNIIQNIKMELRI